MSNPKRGYVLIELDGETYQLKLDFNAIASLDRQLGRPFLDAFFEGGFYPVQQAIAVGIANPRNIKEASKAVKRLEASKYAYYVETIMEALALSGIINLDDEESDVESDEVEIGPFDQE